MSDFESENTAEKLPSEEVTDDVSDAELTAYRQRLIEQLHGGDVEREANYQGNHAELLFSRMNNPAVRGQLLDLLEANERWLSEHPESETVLKRDPQTNAVVETDDGLPVFERIPGTYTPKSRAELEAELTAVLDHEMSVTAIDFNKSPSESAARLVMNEQQPEHHDRRHEAVMGVAPNDTKTPLFNENRNGRMSMVEAHEKGHALRTFKSSEYLKERFEKAFDLSTINADEYREGVVLSEEEQHVTPEDVVISAQEYFSPEKPEELFERMSQLKNYFGFKGDEVFTKKHLQYAREHYVADGHIDNHMVTFFNMITPEKEDAFIELMNSSGI